MTQPSVAMDLMRRAVTIAERQRPEMADSAMEVPLGYFNDPELAARERESVRDLSSGALVSSNEIPLPHDYIVAQRGWSIGPDSLETSTEGPTPS